MCACATPSAAYYQSEMVNQRCSALVCNVTVTVTAMPNLHLLTITIPTNLMHTTKRISNRFSLKCPLYNVYWLSSRHCLLVHKTFLWPYPFLFTIRLGCYCVLCSIVIITPFTYSNMSTIMVNLWHACKTTTTHTTNEFTFYVYMDFWCIFYYI